uniref:Uncharacterized protein LOC114342190 n=1 Tax=Diabrotica virgifera virgifera TaxID=50390 RepID=A0A6P7GGC3_DIAVI
MVMCFAPSCKHDSEQKMCKFFVFPAELSERQKWINLIRRENEEPSQDSLVCSCHFVDQDRKNRPTIFERSSLDEGTTSSSIDIVDERAKPSRNSPEPGPPTSMHTEEVAGCLPEKSNASVDAENHFLKEVNQLTGKLKNLSCRFSFEQIKNNDAHVEMYTGITSSALYLVVFDLMNSFELNYYEKWQVTSLPKIDQMLMTLMKLRLNLPHEDLAIRFNCSTATVTNTLMTWIYALHEVLFKHLMDKIPSRAKNQISLPTVFLSCRNCRIILDCIEVHTETPTSSQQQQLTDSSFKDCNTWKVLVGVAPNGVVTYVSSAYAGPASNRGIVEHCGILDQMGYGDVIVADKDFLLLKDLLPKGVDLHIPPFRMQLTEAQVYETEIPKLMIPVERAIRRIKCYNILQQIPNFYLPQTSVIVQLCAALTNFLPLIIDDEQYYL